jgi:hypothetical protein
MAMIYTYDGTNPSISLTTSTTYSEVFYYLKQTLKQAGWTVTASGDGRSTYSLTGDVITGPGTLSAANTAANNGTLCNTNAWFVVKQPSISGGVQRQFLVQRANVDYQWTVKLSYSAGFTGGSPGNATAPTASDSQTLLSVASIFPTTYSSYRYSISADNAAPYGFWAVWWSVATGTIMSGLVMEPLVAGSYDASETDPYVYYFPNNGSSNPPASFQGSGANSGLSGESSNVSCMAYYKKGTASEAFVAMPALVYSNSGGTLAIPGANSPNPYNSRDEIFPILYGRRTGLLSSIGFKGIGSLMKWVGPSRATGDTLSIAASGAKDRIVLASVSVPWNGTSPVV